METNLITDRIVTDFNRDLLCLLGLPIDNLTMESTKKLLREKLDKEGNYVLSTINVNWVVESFRDPTFRTAIINSDIVTIDGKPLLWIAKIFGLPLKEVVAGSSLIENLNSEITQGKPFSLFLFGGEDGVAELAMKKVNKQQSGLHVVGYLSPGFGSVEEMSTDAIISTINNANPDILLVALGAKKGTRWIEHNKSRLKAKIISHLGATINFLAGTVTRAPKSIQGLGLEWVWRIMQEPKLATRYAKDGLMLLKILLIHSIANLRFAQLRKKIHLQCQAYDTKNIVKLQEDEGTITIIFGENILTDIDSPVRRILSSCAGKMKSIILDFNKTVQYDKSFLPLLLILKKYQQKHNKNIECIGITTQLKFLTQVLETASTEIK